jgi:hypothetical protein
LRQKCDTDESRTKARCELELFNKNKYATETKLRLETCTKELLHDAHASSLIPSLHDD